MKNKQLSREEKNRMNFLCREFTNFHPLEKGFFCEVIDYHEFKYLRDSFKEYLKLNYKYEELGCDGRYHAIFYMGEKPVELINLLKRTYEFGYEEDY